MKNFIYLLIILALIQGCADNITDVDPSELKIEIKKPLDNDSIGYKGETVQYELYDNGDINFIELYVNKNFVNNFPPAGNQKPVIRFEVDSSFSGDRVEIYLVFYGKNGNIYKSNTVKNVLVTEDKTMPSAPADLKIILLSNTSLNLSWQDNSPYVNEYEIWRSENNDTVFHKHLTAPGNVRNINDENLQSGVIYYYKIRGISKNGISDFSTVVNSQGSGGSSSIPAPGNLNASVTDFQVIKLTWKDNSNNENYFKLERRRPWSQFETIGYADANATSYTDSSSEITGGADYFYRVKAVSSSDSSWSNEAYTTMPFYFLKPPAIISVTNISSRRVTIKWRDNDQRWSDFVIERKENSADFIEAGRVTGSVTSFSDSVRPGQNYAYRIKEDDGIYTSAYSDEAVIHTEIIPLPEPQNLSGYFDGNTMIITWEYEFDAEEFKLERRDAAEQGAFSEIAVIGGIERQYADDSTICQHTYVYRLRSADPYSVSPYSAEKVIKNWKNCP